MPALTLNSFWLRRAVFVLASFLFVFVSANSLRASIIQTGNVTAVLGPTFFLDDATNGGTDTDYNTNGSYTNIRTFGGLLTRDQGPTRVTFTGFGFAAHTATNANTASNVNVSITYLGANGSYGGGDDVFIGTRSGTYNFTGGGEYVFAFDTPLTTNLPITERAFGIVINPNGKMKLKSGAISYQTNTGPRLSVAGVAAPVINPQRVNLAKYQAVTASSVAGNRLASYATDGDAGIDSFWQSQNWAFNNGRIDFPFPVEIGSAQVFMGVNDTPPLAKFVIQYLVGSTWTTIPSADISSNTNVERNLIFTTPITATSFRIMVTDPTIRLREFALYPPNGPGGYPLGTDINLNLAAQRPAVASSFVAGSFPLNAVDGRTHAGSSWQTTTAGVNTLDIDLVSSTKIGSVHLYSGSNTSPVLADFTLKSWNGTAWVDIPGGTVTGNTDLDRIVTFATPPTTTRVRLEFTKSTTTPTFIRELQIFPANTGNVGYPLGTGINLSGSYPAYEAFSDALYRITNVAAERDIAVANSGQPALESAGITVAQTRYQVLLNLSDGTYRLRNWDTGECLSGAQLSKTPGAMLTDEPYLALPHQDWILEPLGQGRHRIVNAWSGLAIDTQAGATAQGTALVQNTPGNAASQQWRFAYETWAPKKGLGHSSYASAFDAEWVYNWGPNRPENLIKNVVFNPMQWGSYNWAYNTGSGPIWQRTSEWRKRGDGMILMGFNEPDRTDQANIPVATAVDLWPQVMALNQPLVGPAPADDGTWLTSFTSAAQERGYRWNYTGTHAYPGPSGGSANGLINDIQNKFDTFGLPVWLTEFSFVDWGKNQNWSEEDCYQTLAEFLWRAENFAPLRKYALFIFTANTEYPQPANPWEKFTPAPRSNSYDEDGNMTAFGKLYSGWDGDTTIRTEKSYIIHNRNLRKRMANAATGNGNPGGRTIRTDGPIVNWTLVSTGSSNRYYIVSSIDGRRLSHTTGSGSPSLALPGTTGVSVEWSLTHNQHGWYYVGHPSTNLRLRLASFNTTNNVASYQMVAASTTDENTQWRFIVPPPATTGPTVSSVPDQVSDELAPLTFTVSATDSNVPSLPLFYSIITPLPWGATFNASTGVFSWTPTETQGNGTTTTLTIRVSNGQFSTDSSVNITVNEVNVAPRLATIPAQSVNEGSLVTFTAVGSDTDIPANTLTYSLLNAPSGATIDPGTGVFNWTPTEAQGPGTFNFTVRVSDGNLTADRPVTVTVNEVNTAPALAAIPPKTVSEGVQLSFTAAGTDADIPANILTYSLIGAPAGAAINSSTGSFTWTPTEAQGPGSFNFTVRVSDGSLTADRTAAVTVHEVNTAPTLAAIEAQTVDEGSQLSFTVSGTDGDLPADSLTYSLIGAPVGAAIDSSTGLFTWTPDEAQGPGTFEFAVRVHDGTASADRPVSVEVNEVNTAPVLTAIATQSVDAGKLLSFTATATDTDFPVNPLSFSLVNGPAGATIHPLSGNFTWTPSESQVGTSNFAIQVSDGSLTDSQDITVNVTEPVPSNVSDEDGDGLPDLLEYALGTDPNFANASPFRMVGANPDGTVTLEFQWNPEATGVSWQIHHGSDLTNVADWPAISPGTISTVREGNIDRITVKPSRATTVRGFYVLKVLLE
jgi:hypothetical protein